jgi:hypothetical protein
MATVRSDDSTLIDYDIQGSGPPVVGQSLSPAAASSYTA